MAEKNKPVDKFRFGGVVATVWKNTRKVDGQSRDFFSVDITRTYKDGEEWKTTSSYNPNDLQKVIMAATKAYESIMLKHEAEDS